MSNLSLERLLFDDADIAAGPKVGAYITDGTYILALDTNGYATVNVNGSVTVTATDLDIRDLVYTSDSVTAHISDGTNNLAIDGSGYITVNVNGSVTVTATDLDIRDLVYTSDSVSAHITNGTYDLAIDSNGYITANINGSVTVTATDLDIRDLVYTSDSVTAHQGGTWSVTTDDLPNIVPLQQRISVTDTAVALPTTPLTGRKRIQIQNLGAEPIYLGKSTVTVSGATGGLMIPKGATETLEAGPAALWYAIAPAGKTVSVTVLEW